MRIALILGLVLSVSGCASMYGDGTEIGTKGGKRLYQSSCTVDLSTAGKQGLFGTGPIPVHGTCEVAAANRCPSGFKIEDVKRANFRYLTDRFVNGNMVQTRRYPAQDVVLRFTCKA